MANLQLIISAVGRASGTLSSIEKKAGGVGKAMGTVMKAGALGAAAGLAVAVPGVISAGQAASDLNEAVNKAQVTFGKATPAIEKFAETSAKSFGISRRAAFDYTS